jgi:hypothetical protein
MSGHRIPLGVIGRHLFFGGLWIRRLQPRLPVTFSFFSDGLTDDMVLSSVVKTVPLFTAN